jgi:hypothetical protein
LECHSELEKFVCWTSLRLDDNVFLVDLSIALRGLPKLSKIMFSFHDFTLHVETYEETAEKMAEMFAQVDSLEELHLECLPVDRYYQFFFESLQALPNLRKLAIDSSGLSARNVEHAAQILQRSSSLDCLSLDVERSVSLEPLVLGLQNQARLKSLAVGRCPLSSADLDAFVGILENQNYSLARFQVSMEYLSSDEYTLYQVQKLKFYLLLNRCYHDSDSYQRVKLPPKRTGSTLSNPLAKTKRVVYVWSFIIYQGIHHYYYRSK